MMLIPPDKRDYAAWMAAIGCQGMKPTPHSFANKNDNSNGDTMKAVQPTELDDQLCGDKVSYEAESRNEDSLVALHEMKQGRRYIRRVIVACAYGAINRNCPAP